MSGLPPLLSFEPEGFVSGTITADPGPYTVIISAKDESNPEIRRSFVITVEGVPTALQVRIVHPGDRFYGAGSTLSGNTAIPISLTADGYTLSEEGLPRGLALYQDRRTSRDWYIAGRIRDDVNGRHTVKLEATLSGVVVSSQAFDITITGGTGGGGGSGGGSTDPSWFDQDLYNALVYDTVYHKTEGRSPTDRSVVLPRERASTLNFLFYTRGVLVEGELECNVPPVAFTGMMNATSNIIRQATGFSHTGLVRHTKDPDAVRVRNLDPSWVIVSFLSPDAYNDAHGDYEEGDLAAAGIGTTEDEPFIDFVMEDDHRKSGFCAPVAPHPMDVFIHEVGHVLGFFHVPAESWVMSRESRGRQTWNPVERAYMNRAYQLGPGYPRGMRVWGRSVLPDSVPARPPGPAIRIRN